jgi:general secretion pathway protein C
MKPKVQIVQSNFAMKPGRFVVILLLLAVVFASAVYWIMRFGTLSLSSPPTTTIASSEVPGNNSATVALFGAQPETLFLNGSLQATGVVIAPDPGDSVAIVISSGRAHAFRIGAEIAPGVHLTEVHRQYVTVSDGMRTTRIDLPKIGTRPAAATGDTEQPPDSQTEQVPAGAGLRGEPPHSSVNQDGETPPADPNAPR